MQHESLVLDQAASHEIHHDGIIVGRRGRAGRCRVKECPVCLGQHEEQIHDATLSVRQWFRGEVTKSFDVVFYE
ncbi:MAG: hypothetical protein ABSH44_23600 [Bryobacteraceae bacterium]|jgi:hypothetical protein